MRQVPVFFKRQHFFHIHHTIISYKCLLGFKDDLSCIVDGDRRRKTSCIQYSNLDYMVVIPLLFSNNGKGDVLGRERDKRRSVHVNSYIVGTNGLQASSSRVIQLTSCVIPDCLTLWLSWLVGTCPHQRSCFLQGQR